MKEAMLYSPLENGKVQCSLCNHECIIPLSKRGLCGVRENREGRLYTLVYGRKVIERVEFQVIQNDVVNGECRDCHIKIDGLWR
jgi:hypothetical protein